MKVILLKDVAKIGKKYETKEVADGYAQNLLIPKGLAVAATPDCVKKIANQIAQEEGEMRIQKDLLLKTVDELKQRDIIIKRKVNEKGHLFGSLHVEELVKEIEAQTRIKIDKSYLILEKPIKEIGDYNIPIKVDNTKIAIKISVKSL